MSQDLVHGLISTIGQTGFIDSLHQAVNQIAPMQRAAIFVYDDSGTPTRLVTAKSGPGAFSEEETRRYRKLFFKCDKLVRQMHSTTPGAAAEGDLCFALHRNEDIPNADWLSAYVRVKLTKRISLVRKLAEGWLSLHFYHGDEESLLTTEQIKALTELAPLLSLFSKRHIELSNPPQGHALEECREMLLNLQPDLAPRELDVCSLILKGLTVKEIGVDLGIAQSSVISYRKRAYQRLHVSNAKELMTVCF